ncbi:MAG: single-stranded-DNA-specific exonuclease RecJ [Hyphomonadaceae bacterium]|nr:single-stranded-DNA-specific exonuclease RecJ [Hyphomonadaceae bacterium]
MATPATTPDKAPDKTPDKAQADKAQADAKPRAFLGVSRSLSGRVWRHREADTALAEDHRRKYGLPEIAARLLAARGVTREDAPLFLKPTLKDLFPDPSSFMDMDKAATAIEDAIVSGQKTAVIADYDVDGGTSAAQLVRYFRARGRELRVYVPDRLTEGYGPSNQAFDTLKAEGAELVITVDCGAAAEGPLNHAAELGLKLVVLDHHLMHGPPPKAHACVNPNRPDDRSGQGHLTAAGVVLVALAAVSREARKRGSIGSNNLPDLREMLDLAALGTVCDVAPLTGFNRAIVTQGLKVLRNGKNPGLAALARNAGRTEPASVYDLGFILGPRINAGGRIGDPSLAPRLLATDDSAEADEIAALLEDLNAERRKREAEILLEAEGMAAADPRPVVVIGAPKWHPGLIGIVAGRLKEKVLKPVIVLGAAGEGEPAKGSGRSIPGVNLGRAVAAATKAGLTLAGGGHAMAAGLSIEWDKVEALKDFLSAELQPEIDAAGDEAHAISIDAVGALPAFDLALCDALDQIGPYGQGHPQPIFAVPDLRVSYARAMGQDGAHVRCVLEDARGARLRAVAFRVGGTATGEALLSGRGAYHVAVRVKRDTFLAEPRAEIEIIDVAAA